VHWFPLARFVSVCDGLQSTLPVVTCLLVTWLCQLVLYLYKRNLQQNYIFFFNLVAYWGFYIYCYIFFVWFFLLIRLNSSLMILMTVSLCSEIRNIGCVQNWCTTNHTNFDAGKTELVSFYRESTVLTFDCGLFDWYLAFGSYWRPWQFPWL
jgi:hypothetical protein